MRTLTRWISFILVLFVLPLGLSAIWWINQDRPESWRAADWGTSGVLPAASGIDGAVVHVMAARTGGLKGAFSVHSWIVTKAENESRYTRYDKVGWGQPIRVNAYAADANWYSNRPFVVKTLRGRAASLVIPQIEAAVASYPYNQRGDYRIWPGPNSNTFIAHVLRETPGLDASLPPNAVGKDYLGEGWFHITDDRRDAHLSVFGLAGISVGMRNGFELQLLGQSAGFDITAPALKLPGIGRIGLDR